ncbi:MAG: hypothetical protein E6R03_06750 [Hyphomicrobiaceae bacterium]|nr:MAG: hypothetical protein E6R03_06750 [Hyphomicrobiaceae bacterium]
MYLDWSETGRDYFVIDIETDSLEPTIIWVMCSRNVLTGETYEYTDYNEIRDFFRRNKDAVFVGHNILRFDAPHLANLVGIPLSVRNCIDTLVLSTLYSPSLSGGHSLGAWGLVLGREKIEFNDFSRLTDEMVTYCHRDVEITTELFIKLIKVLAKIKFTERSIWIQHRLTVLLDRQQRNGFYFDGPRAVDFYRMLRTREGEIADEVHQVFLPERVLVAERSMFKKDGQPTSIYIKDRERYFLDEDPISGVYSAFEDVEFNLGSPKQRIDKLIELGWEPQEFTEKGNPKPFDKGKLSPSLEKFLADRPVPEVELIAKWMSINGRANMVNTWLEAWNETDSCIHGTLFVADTLRLRHQKPNTANIPGVRLDRDKHPVRGEQGYFTYEARDLWTARPGRVLVGTDASGLELRMLAHYINRADFTKQVVEGDPHQFNADLVGITRSEAKTLIYAIQYGAQDRKVAKMLGVSISEGGRIRTMFLELLGLKDVMDAAIKEQQNGRVELIDGSKVICPSPHAALNYKLQGSGARVMGLAAILLEQDIRREGLDSLKVGDIHDEWQYDVDPNDAERHALLSVEAIRRAGELLQLNVPLGGEAKQGRTWAETH